MVRQPLRRTGLAAVATLWTTIGAATLLEGFDLLGPRPLSWLGTEPGSALLFSGGLAAAALLLVGFHEHVRARYPVTPGFSAAMLVGLAGQLVAALVPIGGGEASHRVHTTSALVLGASLPVLMWRFAASQPPGRWRRVAYWLFWGEAAACAAGLWLSGPISAPVAEILPASFFHLWIVVLTVAPMAVGGDPSAPGAKMNEWTRGRSGV